MGFLKISIKNYCSNERVFNVINLIQFLKKEVFENI